MGTFTPLDLIVFFSALTAVMVVGFIAGRKEKSSEDYFLAGKNIPWWGVAGSIFGSNVSANHMVGMMGIGFTIGFAQSHFELGAIAGLMLLCYGFLPVYRKLNVFTLSEYLGRRYDNRSRLAYAIIMVLIMAVVQMVPGLYIGARSICILLGGDAVVQEAVDLPAGEIAGAEAGSAGAEKTKLNVNKTYYIAFVIALAVISGGYTILGGLKAVVWTDVIQSMLLLSAGLVVAFLTFYHLGGWGAMIALDTAGANKMHLYLPSNHPELPWTGALTGLMAMHFFYWGTNQFIVQRALAARSDSEARLGIIAAGFLKLLIPFFAIATGIAAYYLFQQKVPERAIASDAAFPELVKLVIPVGFGIIGLISAGLIGAILSSIDSMMNSAATIVTFDVYKPYFNPQASDEQMIKVGRLAIVVFVVLAALMAIFVMDPNSEGHFFLLITNYSNFLTPGLLVAFFMGMVWRRGTGTGAFVTIICGVLFSWGVEAGYNNIIGMNPAEHSVAVSAAKIEDYLDKDFSPELQALAPDERPAYIDKVKASLAQPVLFFGTRAGVIKALGPRLAFFHRVMVVIVLCVLVHVLVSLLTKPEPEKQRLVWTDLGGHRQGDLGALFGAVIVSIGVYAVLGWIMVAELLTPTLCGVLAVAWTMGMFLLVIRITAQRALAAGSATPPALVRDDRFWAGLLCSTTMFMMYYFY